MHSIELDRSVLVLIDYQTRLLPSIDDADRVIAEAVRLADMAIALGVPVIGTEQNPPGLGPNHEAIRTRCSRTIEKTHFDACADGLLDAVADARADRKLPLDIVIAGCEAHVCLMQTSLGLMRAGHRVWVVSQACASRLPFNHQQAMRRLRQGGATMVGYEMVAFEWLRDCRHDRFRTVLPMLKATLD